MSNRNLIVFFLENLSNLLIKTKVSQREFQVSGGCNSEASLIRICVIGLLKYFRSFEAHFCFGISNSQFTAKCLNKYVWYENFSRLVKLKSF